ncbi:hypothetical protein D9613_008296 [Agrocybe pediades]|uniref:Uncharacterized protein n=1 Tax=Agrocybe pediades TaxID=84607 RepID=A0A8H4QU98_9AGAR|nr:hypothetical protein D9613_008296 [Agrocybe pediades]
MALSVSGFPEPSRHASAPSEVFTGDGGGGVQDAGFGKAGLMNSPRLRGLFGASSSSGVGSSSSKRPDTRNPPTTSKQDAEGSGGLGISGATEESSQSSSATATTPPTTPSLSFSTSSFEPLPQAEYELELQLPPMAALPPLDIPRPSGSKRPGLPPLPSRKTTQSPVRLGPNLSRLDIAASWARSPPTLHQPHPKALPPSVVIQEWKGGNSANNVSLSTSPPQQPRPLPSVPANTVDSAKAVSNAVAGPSKHANAISATTVPVAGPSSRHASNAVAGSSKHVNAVAGSSKQVNAVAGPSKQANAAAGSSKHPDALTITPAPPTATTSSTSSSTSSSPPTSKVIITQTTAQSQQTHKNTTSLSMRYQPLVAEPQAECSNSAAATASGSSSKNPSSDAATTATNQSNSVMISSPVRPLPRIPPTTTAISTSVSAASSSSSGSSTSTSNLHPEQSTAGPSSRTTPPPRVNRPKTSPSPITGFALPSPGPSSGLSFGNNGKSAASATTTTSSSSIITASTASSGGMSSSFSRSPFDTITTGHLNINGSKVLPARAHPNAQQHAHAHARRANSPPLPVGGSTKLLPPRARSHSRPRRDRSLDSFYANSTSTSKPPSRVSSPIMAAAGFGINNFPSPSPGSNGGVNGVSSPTGARSPRSLPSPTSTVIGGARPIPKKSGTLSHHNHHHHHNNTNKTALHIQTSTTSLAAFGSSSLPSKSFAAGSSHGGSTWVVTSPSGRRSQPPSPPTGPVKPRSNTMAAGSGMTLHAPVASSRVLPKILVDAAPVLPVPVGPAVSVSTAVASSPSSLSSTSVGGAGSSSGKGKEVAGAAGIILDLHSILETQSIDSGMHNHPIEALSDDSEAPPVESASAPLDKASPTSPIVGTPTADSSESPIEAYIYDPDQDMSLSRSPSPIRYARPESAGLFLSDTDLEEEITYAPGPSAYDSETSSGVSSRASSVDASGLVAGGLGAGGLGGGGGTGGGGGRRRRRTQQLRSYRNSYRPRSGRSSPPYIPYERPSSPAREVVQPTVPVGTVEGKRDSKSKKKKARSYFGGGGGGGAGGSTPGTRASSPERKSRSRQPRRLAEAVSTALEEVRNRGRGGSSSPKRKGKADGNSSSSNNLLVPGGGAGAGSQMEMEVLDISLPSLTRRETDGTIDTRSSVSDSQNASLNPSQVQIYTTTSTGNATSSARSSAKVGWAKVIGRKKSEIGDVSSSASGSAAQLNVEQEVSWTETWTTSQGSKPSKSTHRRVGSLGAREDDADPMANADEEDETYKTPGITLSKIETTITSTVTVTRPPSSSVSTPFSGFSITGKSKNKDKDKKRRAMSVTTPSTGSTTDRFGDKPRLIVHKTYEGHEGGHDVGGWVDLRNADDDDDEEDELDEDGVRVKRGRKRSSGGARRASLDEGEVVVVTTKRVKREVDVDGELWDHEQETGMADVIQDLRSLKASRG